MNSQILYEVQKILKQQKVDAAFQAKQNVNSALAHPEIKQVDSRRRELIMLVAMAEFENKDASALRAELKQAEQQENALLKKLNLTINSFLPQTFCQTCNDSGFYNGSICSCAKTVASKLLLQKSGYNRPLATFAQSDFSLFGENKPEIESIYKKMQLWVTKPNSDVRTILLYGQTGTGKTFLTECMASALIELGNYVYITTSFNLVQNCLKYHTAFAEDKKGLLEPFLESDVLFIDDLGTEPMLKNVTHEYLLMILNERMSNNKRTVISTNLLLDQIEQRFDERLFSRIFNKRSGIALRMEGGDLRLKKSAKK